VASDWDMGMMTGGRNCSHCGARLGTRDRVCFSCQRESGPASPSGSDGSAAGADVAGTTRKAGHLPQAGSGSTAIRVAERQAAERAGPERSLQLELIWGNCPACGDGPMPNDRFCQSCGTEIRSAGASSPTRRSMPADHVGMPCARRRGLHAMQRTAFIAPSQLAFSPARLAMKYTSRQLNSWTPVWRS